MSEILLDDYVSPGYLAHHSRIDQYQTYSLIVDDSIARTRSDYWEPGLTYENEPPLTTQGLTNQNYGLPGYPQSTTTNSNTTLFLSNSVVAFDTFVPGGKIPFDFGALAVAYPVQRGTIRNYKRRICIFDGNTYGLRYVYTWDQTTLAQSTGWTITAGGSNGYRDLITGHPSDPRQLPTYMEGVAASDRTITYAYYRRNELEDHPKVWATLDWLQYSQPVRKGQRYRLTINNPVLGTLSIDGQTFGELVDRPGDYPKIFLPIGAPVGSLISSWAAGSSTTNGIVGGTNTPGTYDSQLGWDNDSTFHMYQKSVTEFEPLTRILAANNDWWDKGTFTSSQNPPAPGHPALDCNENALFYQPNADGSIGQLTMDSIRLKEIWAALGAGDYATDPESGGPRVVNLGWMIDRLTKLMGIRRKPNGKFLSPSEAEKYKRTRLNKPTWPAGQYSDSEWGNEGMAIPYLPTSYENGQRQDNQHDLVHDLPQLLQALHDQIDASQGIQHNGEIRIPVGGKIQSYPNQGAMITDLAIRAIELQAMAEKMLVMNVETSNSVRELFAGIGIPVSSKSVPVQIAGKTKQIYYPAFQAGKGSVVDRLTALAQNIGIIIGALMPRDTKNEPLNPFERKPK